MKAVILAGGLGTRLSEETDLRPKPMVEVGGRPILWHIMSIYAQYGVDEFVICGGYKAEVIKRYFADYRLHSSDVTFDLVSGGYEIHDHRAEPFRITVVDTGADTETGGRIKRVGRFLDDEPFLCTYGDGVGNVDIDALVRTHTASGRMVTLTAVPAPSRYGLLDISPDGSVVRFDEKPAEAMMVNGGFFVIDPAALDAIEGDESSWEHDVLPLLVSRGEVGAYRHEGFWQPMDTLRDRRYLERLWATGNAPWVKRP